MTIVSCTHMHLQRTQAIVKIEDSPRLVLKAKQGLGATRSKPKYDSLPTECHEHTCGGNRSFPHLFNGLPGRKTLGESLRPSSHRHCSCYAMPFMTVM